jgi:hypothetical protein
MAMFLVLVWRLHFEPAHFTRVPTSSRARIALITQFIVAGVFAIGAGVLVVSVLGEFAMDTTSIDMVLVGCVGVVPVLVGLVLVWLSIVDLRRAVRLRRQHLRQPAGE